MRDSFIDSFDFENAPFALQTYYCYVRAWVEDLISHYGEKSKCFDNIEAVMNKSIFIQKLQGGRILDKDIVAAYTRGQLTLKAMKTFPIKSNTGLAPTANLWLPVQAYYAIHGMGLATLLSLGQSMPKDHRAFKSSFSGLVSRYFSSPLNALCYGGPSDKDYVFKNLNATSQKVKQQSNLSNPKFADIDCILGKCLSTTRVRLLNALFSKERRNKVRPGKKRRNLSNAVKRNISNKLHSTTLIDFIYRMRVRSNYEEPDIYLYASEQQTDEAVNHYNDLLFLTQVIVYCLSLIIRKKIGNQEMDKLEKKFNK